jgi:hypothetical protein
MSDHPLLKQKFNKNMILEDAYVIGFDSKFPVQKILEDRESFLSTYSIKGKLFSTHLNALCKEQDIDARLIILTLQKEQGLIYGDHSKNPSQHTLDWALGFGAEDDGRKEEFRGIEKQIEAAIIWWRSRWKYAAKRVGVPIKTDDHQLVTPQNAATVLCYRYTPYVGNTDTLVGNTKYNAPFANYLLWLIKQKMFV